MCFFNFQNGILECNKQYIIHLFIPRSGFLQQQQKKRLYYFISDFQLYILEQTTNKNALTNK